MTLNHRITGTLPRIFFRPCSAMARNHRPVHKPHQKGGAGAEEEDEAGEVEEEVEEDESITHSYNRLLKKAATVETALVRCGY